MCNYTPTYILYSPERKFASFTYVTRNDYRDQVSTLTNTICRFEKGLQKRDDFRENKRTMMDSITQHKDKLLVRKQNKLASLNTSHGSHTQRRRRRRRKKKKLYIQSQPLTTCTTTKNTVINLSGVPLSEAESSLLDKGLSFCPTPPRMNTFQLQYDLAMFYRRLRLREYFYDEESLVSNRETQHNPFRLRNKRWMPAKKTDEQILRILRAWLYGIADLQ